MVVLAKLSCDEHVTIVVLTLSCDPLQQTFVDVGCFEKISEVMKLLKDKAKEVFIYTISLRKLT